MVKRDEIHARVGKETKDKLKKLAKEDKRSQTNWITKKIDEEYEKRK